MLKLRLIILRAFFDFIASQEDKDKLNQVIENFNKNLNLNVLITIEKIKLS